MNALHLSILGGLLLTAACKQSLTSAVKSDTTLVAGSMPVDLTTFVIDDPEVIRASAAGMEQEALKTLMGAARFQQAREAAAAKIAAKRREGGLPPGVTDDELFAIYMYTTHAFEAINSDLRDIKLGTKTSTDYPNTTKLAASGLNKLPRHRCSTRRGMNTRNIAAWQKLADDRYFIENGLMSTSEHGGFGGRLQIVFSSDTCRMNISWLSDKPEEDEVLFPPGMEMEIVRIKSPGKTYYFCMRDATERPRKIQAQATPQGGERLDAHEGDIFRENKGPLRNVVPVLPIANEALTWHDLVCGMYELQNAGDAACANAPARIEFRGLEAAVSKKDGQAQEPTSWELVGAGTKAPQVKIGGMVLAVDSISQLSLQGCVYKEQ